MDNILKEIIEHLSNSSFANIESYIKESGLEDINSLDNLRAKITAPLNLAKGQLVKHFVKDFTARFLILQEDFVHFNLKQLFSKYEGSACCADKARLAADKAFMYFEKQQPIVFSDDDSFARPQRILTTEGEVLTAIKTLKSLWYGKSIEVFYFVENR